LRGLDAAAIGRLICPIGIPGIGGKLPAEIAIAVAAQILQLAPAEPAAAQRAALPGITATTRTNARRDALADCRDCAGTCQPQRDPAVKVQA
jgi:hypothetical protein